MRLPFGLGFGLGLGFGGGFLFRRHVVGCVFGV
jgi:hypothetical protein